MSWQYDIRRKGLPALLALGLVAVAPSAASAISFSGIDAQSQYTGFVAPGSETPGLFTFNDTMNGTNPSPEPGVVTNTNGIAGVLGGVIDLEILLDTSGGFDPATGNLLGAVFGGTGGGEILVYDAAQTTVLLAFNVSFVKVGNVSGTNNLFEMGDPEGSSVSFNSLLTVAGGSLAASVGGVGTPALIDLLINDPDPPLPTSFPNSFLAPGYLNDSFNSGFAGAGTANAGVNWAITIIPEPTTASLLALGLVALGARGRRRRA